MYFKGRNNSATTGFCEIWLSMYANKCQIKPSQLKQTHDFIRFCKDDVALEESVGGFVAMRMCVFVAVDGHGDFGIV